MTLPPSSLGAPEPTAQAEPAQKKPEAIGPTVLIVDDLPDAREVLARLLRRQGYQAETAKDGASAVSLIARHCPDLLLLDLAMPGMDGIETLRRVRSLPCGHRLPVVLFTATTNPALLEEARRLGVVQIVTKGSTSAGDLIGELGRYLTISRNEK